MLMGIVVSLVLGILVVPGVVPGNAPGTVKAENGVNCAAGNADDCLSGFVCKDKACVSAEGEFEFGLDYAENTGLGKQDIRTTISKIINVALGLLGIVAVVIMLIGGFEWMTAGGNEEKVTSAKQRIFMGILGLAIILSAYAIAKFVLEQLYMATTGQPDYTEDA